MKGIIANEVAFQWEGNDVLGALHTAISLDSRDWSLSQTDAWIYGIVVGWEEATDELKFKFGWTDSQVQKLQELHERYKAFRVPDSGEQKLG